MPLIWTLGPRAIRTEHWRKPIPTDRFDWQAMFDDDEPSDGETPDPPCGHGPTELAAIIDLLQQDADNAI
jgi:hypothetical protein